MEAYMPYIVSVVCSAIAGFASYVVARKQAKADIERLIKQHELDTEKEREKFAMEKEKMALEHNHQLEMLQKEMENQLGSDVISAMMKEYMRSPEGRAQMRSVGKKHK